MAIGTVHCSWVISLGLLCLLAVVPAHAENRVDLYSAEILVPSQSATVRERAARTALRELVVRVSGEPQAAEHPVVLEASSRAQDFIYEFNYTSTRETIEVDGEERSATRLGLKFSPSEIERLLRSAGLPLWPSNRPSVLVWLVAREGDGLHRITGSEERDLLRQRAGDRGLPMILPLDDLEDRLALSARQLWELEEPAIRDASRRYDADAILVGRYSKTSSGRLRSDWQLYHPLANTSFDLRAEAVEALLPSAVDQVANRFAELYAIVPREEGPDTLVVQLGNIEGFGAYKEAERYLSGLALVRRVELASVRPGVLTLRLITEGDVERLLSTLDLDRKLIPAAQSNRLVLTGDRFQPQGTLGNPLVYTWQ